MTVAIEIVPASGDIVAVVTATHITVTGGEDTDSTTYDEDLIPTEEAIPYRLVASLTGTDDLVSHEFVVSADGDHQWDGLIFPTDGAWTLDLIDQRDDSTAATLAVTVTA